MNDTEGRWRLRCLHAVGRLAVAVLLPALVCKAWGQQAPERKPVQIAGVARAVNVTTGQQTIRPADEGLLVAPGDHLSLSVQGAKFAWDYVWAGEERPPVSFAEREVGETRELVVAWEGEERVAGMRGRWGEQILAISDLAELWGSTRGLVTLDLQSSDIGDLTPLADIKRLRHLNMNECWCVTDLRPLGMLKDLRVLDLSDCMYVRDISPLAGARQLASLDLLGCRGIGDLRPLASLRSLSRLRVEVKTAADLAAVSEVRSLTDLDLIAHGDVGGLRPLAALKNLRSLRLTGFGRLSDLSALAAPPELRELWVADAAGLADLAPLARAPALRKLHLWLCPALTDLSPLTGLDTLELLDLWQCEKVSDLSPLSKLTRLTTLRLSQCGAVESLNGLGRMPGLRTLGIGVGCGVGPSEVITFSLRNPRCEISY